MGERIHIQVGDTSEAGKEAESYKSHRERQSAETTVCKRKDAYCLYCMLGRRKSASRAGAEERSVVVAAVGKAETEQLGHHKHQATKCQGKLMHQVAPGKPKPLCEPQTAQELLRDALIPEMHTVMTCLASKMLL